MIRIHKPARVPEKLATDGKTETEKDKALFSEFEEEFRTGKRKFEFKKTIYKSVKEELKDAQHGKCCFCEREAENFDVEHFRPKSAWQQKPEDKLSRPGYYWLVYDWDNLFYSCEKCNRTHKRNRFPLADNSKRARYHSDDIRAEEPLFIHPGKENPEEFIEYKGTRPRAINGNKRGRITIEQIGINRPFPDEDRNKVYKQFKLLYEILSFDNIDEQFKDKVRKQLDEAGSDSGKYASMIRCGMRDKFRF